MRTAYTDGACRISNPGLCSCAWVLYEDGVEITRDSRYLGHQFQTNNYAEYQGLLLLLEYLYHRGLRNVVIHCDSKVVVNQVLGTWDVKQPDLEPFASKAYGLLSQGCHVLKHIKGHSGNVGNDRADQLCNERLDEHIKEY
jgi:ribonuclease HI